MEEIRNSYEILVGEPELKRALSRLGVDGMIILEWILGNRVEDLDWIHLAHDRDQWRALVNTVMNLQVP
jgi:hypothetical protein